MEQGVRAIEQKANEIRQLSIKAIGELEIGRAHV